MRLTWKIRRKFLRILSILIAGTLLLVPVTWYMSSNESVITLSQNKPRSYLTLSDILPLPPKEHENVTISTDHCVMGTCFDVSRCLPHFTVYVHPPDPRDKHSPLYEKFLKVLRESPYRTQNPETACLLVLSLDTLDRDTLSKDFTRRLPEKLKRLPYWNNGRNYLIFNLFSGSFPDYKDDLDFPYGEAILAKASFAMEHYRPGFDVSLPLLHHLHQERGKYRGDLSKEGKLFPLRRKYLLVFKGKRYLWGLGSETRNGLHHLNNGGDIMILTTCKHGKFWDRHQDEKCSRDNSLYEKFDYKQLIANSTFCLVPRGRRLGSFRFLESLRAGCIPVSLSNGLVLPFQEVIDWSKALLNFDERQLFQVSHLLRHVGNDKILSMRLQSQFYWEQYLSSVEKVIRTTLEIIRDRIYGTGSHFVWNNFPGALSVGTEYSQLTHDYPFYMQQFTSSTQYTAVILATQSAPKGNSPLVLLLKNLCNSTRLAKVLISWIGSGSPKVMLPSHCSAPIVVRDRRKERKYLSEVLLPLSDINTKGVLSLWESSVLITEEVEFGFSTWLANPERLVGFTSQRHYWSPGQGQWKWSQVPNNRYSLVSLGAGFYHRYYAHYIKTRLPSTVKDILDSSHNCFDVAFNFIISDLVGTPPLKVTQRTTIDHLPIDRAKTISYSSCVHLLANAFGYMPLQYSWTRADPVLYKDNVSALRKEFRRLENTK